MKKNALLKKLLIVFLICSMLMNSSTTVLATTVELISDAVETEEVESEELVEETSTEEIANSEAEEVQLEESESDEIVTDNEEIESEELVEEKISEETDSEEINVEETASEEINSEEANSENVNSEEVNPEETASETVNEETSEPEQQFESETIDEVVAEPIVEPAKEVVEEKNDEIYKISTKFTGANGSIYKIILTYKSDANIPDGANLKVVEFLAGSAEYEAARQAVINDKEERGEADKIDTLDMMALDISIVDADENEIEPEAPVSIEMKIDSLPGVKDLDDVADSIEIQHHVENNGETDVELVAQNGDELNIERNTIKSKFDVESFSTFTITWNNNRNTTTVHHGYLDGNNYVELAQITPTPTTSTNNHAYLIYDFDGYEYSGNTYYRTSATTTNPATGGTQIRAVLRYNNNNWQRRATNSTNWSNIDNNSHIYVLYNKKPDIPVGGTAVAKITDETEHPNEPEILKESSDNHDGTRNLSLSITGHTTPLEAEKLADVIVVFDRSGSMSNGMSGSTRLRVAKNAVNSMANTLLAKTNSNGQKLIRMALISFSTDATVVQGFTDNYSTFSNAVEGLSADGGTNWEKALKLANEIAVDSERATFIVFVTDGNPTFRISRMSQNNVQLTDAQLDIFSKNNNDTYYLSNNVFGEGDSDSQNRNYDAAVLIGQSIVANNKNFYTIGISNDVTKVSNFNNDCGGKAAYLAADSASLNSAFDDIIASITGTLGWNVNISDGITGLTNLTAKTPIVGVDESSFKYYKKAKGVGAQFEEWDPTSEGANTASYNSETGAVEWNLGTNFQLEDDVTYKVEFLVWPSQVAIDYVTQLNNGEIEFSALPEEVRIQISEPAAPGGLYTLKTNTDKAYVKYYESQKVGGTVSIIGEEKTKDFLEVDPLNLDTMTLKVRKIFTDTLTAAEDREVSVSLYLKRRVVNGDGTFGEWEDFSVPYTNPDGDRVVSNIIVLSDSNNWEAEFYISPGLIASGTTYNPGYEFKLEEPNIDYHYDINSEVVKPMLVDTAKQYIGDNDGNEALTAENIVKGGINIEKILHDQEGNVTTDDDTVFTIKGYILDENGNPYTFDPSWDDRTDKSTGNGASAIWQQHQNDTGAYHFYDKDGNRIGYKLHFASTAEIEFQLKAGERVRFVNVPQNATYKFYEDLTGVAEEYHLDEITGQNQSRDADGNYSSEYVNESGITVTVPQPTVANNEVSGTVYGNVQHNVTVTNRRAAVDVTFAGTKTLTGMTLTDDQFSFEIREGNTLIGTATNDATGKINYPSIRYIEAGTHTYTIKETSTGGNGITVDGTIYEVTVTVTEENGILVATISGADSTRLDFANAYNATGSITFEGTKTLSGRQMTSTDIFAFGISENSSTTFVTNDSTGKINYPTIQYQLSDVGTHVYTIKETSTGGNGITVDSTEYTVTVVVTDNGDGTLNVATTDNYKALNFENTYAATGTANIAVSKVLTGRTLANEQFEFVLTETTTGANYTETVKNDANGNVNFSTITYNQSQVGTHTYTITETNAKADGYTYDGMTVTVTVVVTDNGNGTLSTSVSYSADKEFNNTYTAAGTADIAVSKVLTGRTLANEQFEFVLTETTTGASYTETVKNDANGNVNFSTINYNQDQVGTHTYTITETNAGASGYTYDGMTVTVTVEVTDNGNGILSTSVSYSADKEFNNTYAATGTADIAVSKVLTGRTLANNQFEFVLTETTTGANYTETVNNDANGNVNFSTITYNQDQIGTHTYTITETNAGASGYTYDGMTVTVTVEVTDNGNGTLATSVSYSDDTEFNNVYEATGTADIAVSKVLTGRTLANEQFEFVLTETTTGASYTETVKNDASGNVNFSTINYNQDQVGTHTYTITETDAKASGYTYDGMTVTVTVEVTDNGNGTLSTSVSYSADKEFNNVYEATGTADIAVSKVLSGKALANNQFEFVLTETTTGANYTETVNNDARGNVNFSTITYNQDQVGTHTYTITETDAKASGYTYDGMTVTVTVEVTDNGDGTLSTSVTYSDDTEFNNVYQANGNAEILVTKSLTGRTLANEQFEFVLTETTAGANYTETVKNDANGNVNFSAISYSQDQVGTHTYSITETDAGADGYTYDGMTVTVTVEVTDNGDGTLSASVSYSDDTEFNNVYEATGTADVAVSKVLTGRTLANEQFEFVLTETTTGANYTETVKNDVNGNVNFSTITYNQDQVGTHTYTITETDAKASGYTYDGMTVTVTVEVTDNGDGTLSAAVSYSDDKEFNNIYEATGTADVAVSKVLTGRALADGQFEFVLTETTTGASYTETVKNDVNGNVNFSTITYDQDQVGTHTYSITETNAKADGYTYDSMTVTVTVEVTDNGDGTLSAAVSYSDDKEFNNIYEATGTADIAVSKVLTGRTLANEQFEFVLTETTASAGTAAYTETVNNDAKGNVNFSTITYNQDQIGTHTYTITETNAGASGYTYDSMTVTVTVEVTDNGDGTLSASVSYSDDTEFNNVYEAAGTADIAVSKVLTGRTLANEQFEFVLTETTTGANYTETVKNDARGNVNFSTINYNQDQIGTHTYTITETNAKADGYTYDSMTVTVTVEVTDNGDGTLSASVSYSDDTEFNNVYEAAGTADIAVSKVLTGRTLANEQFEFVLTETTTGANYTETVKNDSNGNVNFSTIAYNQDQIGTHTYTITETDAKASGYTYDSMTVTVTVEVTDNGDGTLASAVSYSDDTEFNNVYEAAGTADVAVSKVLTGRALADGQFEFVLTETTTGASYTETVKNDSNGNVNFSTISYNQDQVGTHTYTITETDAKASGYTYDSMTVTVTIEVTDNGDGTLSTSVSYSDDTEFNNVYEATGTADVAVSKVLAGRTLANEQFEFVLTETTTGANYTETVKNDSNGNVNFSTITYNQDQIGTHTYTITETNAKAKGYTYDSMTVTVTVEVTDNGDGTLSTSVSYSDDTEFNNVYEATGTADVAVSKVLTGRTLANEQFEFVLTETTTGANYTETVKNDANGNVNFSTISYNQDQVGTHTYTITETDAKASGYTYDSMTVTVTVEVTDNGDGTLSTSVSYSDDTEFNNVYEATGTAAGIAVSKVLTGRVLEDEQFEFVLTETTTGASYTETVKNDVNGNVNFSTITYDQDQVGTHTYSITETNAKASGYTYDSMTVTVTVEVTDNGDGTLSTAISYSDDKEFNNIYEATGTAEEITVSKILTGRTLEDGQFEFVLTETTTGANYSETVNNDANGNVNFSAITYDQDQVGTHTYSIAETNAKADGYTYDDMTVTVTVEVTDNGDGTLSTSVSYSDDTEFNNVYEATGIVEEIVVTKVLTGKTLEDGQFEFVLTETTTGASYTETVSNDADGNVNFSAITYNQDQVGTHTYSITETNTDVAGYIYDDMTVTVTVEVTDNGDGTLSTSVSYSDDTEFNNVYNITDVSVQKIWDDSDNQYEKRPDSVKVQLYAGEIAIGDIVVLDESNDWTYTWTGLDKSKDGKEIKYSVKEIDVSESYIDLYSVNEDGTLVITNQLVGEGGWEEEIPEEPPYVGENPSTGINIVDNYNFYVSLIIGTMIVVAVVTKRTLI